jgi:hypothetical protein
LFLTVLFFFFFIISVFIVKLGFRKLLRNHILGKVELILKASRQIKKFLGTLVFKSPPSFESSMILRLSLNYLSGESKKRHILWSSEQAVERIGLMQGTEFKLPVEFDIQDWLPEGETSKGGVEWWFEVCTTLPSNMESYIIFKRFPIQGPKSDREKVIREDNPISIEDCEEIIEASGIGVEKVGGQGTWFIFPGFRKKISLWYLFIIILSLLAPLGVWKYLLNEHLPIFVACGFLAVILGIILFTIFRLKYKRVVKFMDGKVTVSNNLLKKKQVISRLISEISRLGKITNPSNKASSKFYYSLIMEFNDQRVYLARSLDIKTVDALILMMERAAKFAPQWIEKNRSYPIFDIDYNSLKIMRESGFISPKEFQYMHLIHSYYPSPELFEKAFKLKDIFTWHPKEIMFIGFICLCELAAVLWLI